VAQPGMDSSMERLREVRSDLGETLLAMANTDLEILRVSHNNTTKELTVEIEVTGSETVRGEDLDFLLDGEVAPPSSAITGPLYPGERFEARFENTTRPGSVLLSGPFGLKWRVGPGSVDEDC